MRPDLSPIENASLTSHTGNRGRCGEVARQNARGFDGLSAGMRVQLLRYGTNLRMGENKPFAAL